MKKVLITGATGFLGRYAVDEFAANGWEVRAFGRNEAASRKLERGNVRFIKGDFSSPGDISDAVGGVSHVIHCGAMSTTWGRWEDFYSANVTGTENVVKACIENNVEKLVYVSSPSIYTAKKDRYDIRENDFDENNDLNYYIQTKILSEKKLREAAGGKLKYCVIRPRGLVGVGDTSIIPRLLKAGQSRGIPLFNGGRNVVDMTSVENVALALRLCAECDTPDAEVYNITNGEPMEFKALLDRFFAAINVQPKYREMEFSRIYRVAGIMEKYYKAFKIYDRAPVITKYLACMLAFSQTLDISKARRDLNYKPVITLEESIANYAESYKD